MSYHGGQRYSYQILSAIAYTFRHRVFAIRIEGNSFEDSIFYDDEDRVFAIGEAKTMESLGQWNPQSLFRRGNDKGPLLQLWNRCGNDEKPILFSSIPMQSEFCQDDKIQIPNDIVSSIVSDVVQRITQGSLRGINRVNEISDEAIIGFLDSLEFVYMPFGNIFQYTMGCAGSYGNVTTEAIGRLEGIFTSPAYVGNVRKIPLTELVTILNRDVLYREFTEPVDASVQWVVDDTEIVRVPEIPRQQVEQVEKLLSYHSKKTLRFPALRKKKRQQKYILEKFQERVIESHIRACKVLTDDGGTLNLPRDFLDIFAMRAYGLLFLATLGERDTPNERNPERKIKIVLEIDPQEIFFSWDITDERWIKFHRDQFFEWAARFKGLEEHPKDRELLSAFELEDAERYRWLSENYDHWTTGYSRYMHLAQLMKEQVPLFKAAIDKAGGQWGKILAKPSVDHVYKLRKAVRD